MTFLRRLSDRIRVISTRTMAGLAVAIAVILVTLASAAWQRCGVRGCPDVGQLAKYQPGGAPVLLDREGEVFADLSPPERTIVPLHALPSHVSEAFIAVEDQRFHQHHGVDWQRIAGAVRANLRSGGIEEGFSTITMQLARNIFPERLPGQQKTGGRKLLEIRVAREIEAKYAKPEILELYLNNIYFGNGAYGIEQASRQYFGVAATDLTLAQAAALAALPKAPSHYDPRRQPERALERRNLVLTLMEQQGRIPAAQAGAAKRDPLTVITQPPDTRAEAGLAPYFVAQVRRQLEELFGDDLYAQPLKIWTTLDSRTQRAAEDSLRWQLNQIETDRVGRFTGPAYSPDAAPSADTRYLQGAVVVLDAATGDVRAWVGGRNFAQSKFDRVMLARRQAGSAFKPFVYAAALRRGFALSQPVEDQPVSVKIPGGGGWKPRNAADDYAEAIPLRDALVFSKNAATVRLAQAVGFDEVAAVARQARLEVKGAPPSIALGAVTVSPLELTTAYTALAAGGVLAAPRLVQRVENAAGATLWSSAVERHQAIEPATAFLITDVLNDALRRGTGAGTLAGLGQLPAAGKTGTTNDVADAWFVGYTPDIVAGVWIGFDQPAPITDEATAGRLAAPVWTRVMERLYTGSQAPQPWRAPADVVALRVDPATGIVLQKGCRPASGDAREELFLQGKEPKAYCPGRGPAPIDAFAAGSLVKPEMVARAQAPTPAADAADAPPRDLSRVQVTGEVVADKAETPPPGPIPTSGRAEREPALEREAPPGEVDVSGWWSLMNDVDSSSVPEYQGLRLGYRIQLEQRGSRITGRGQKWTENGRGLASSARTTITFTGTTDGREMTLTFTEHGTARTTTGTLTLELNEDGRTLIGSFSSTAAQSSGSSQATRLR